MESCRTELSKIRSHLLEYMSEEQLLDRLDLSQFIQKPAAPVRPTNAHFPASLIIRKLTQPTQEGYVVLKRAEDISRNKIRVVRNKFRPVILITKVIYQAHGRRSFQVSTASTCKHLPAPWSIQRPHRSLQLLPRDTIYGIS